MLLVVAKAVVSKLASTSAVTSLVGQRIYTSLPAETAALPYLVQELAGGGDPSLAAGVDADLLWQVRAIALDGLTANQIARAVDGALHFAALTLDTGWHLASIRHDAPFYYVEHATQRQYHHAGWTFRIRLWEG